MKILSVRRARCWAVLLAFLLVFAFVASAQDEEPEAILANANVLTPHRVARIRTVAEAAVSPDGAHVAHMLRLPRQPWAQDEDGPEWAELYVAGADDAARPYVTGR